MVQTKDRLRCSGSSGIPGAKPSAVLASTSLSYRGSVLRRSSVTIAYRLVERRGERFGDACGIFGCSRRRRAAKGLFFKVAKGLADGSRSGVGSDLGMPVVFLDAREGAEPQRDRIFKGAKGLDCGSRSGMGSGLVMLMAYDYCHECTN